MKTSSNRGVTLLEVIIGMLILALVTSGIFGAFVFSRSVGLRSESQLGMMNVGQRILEDLRSAIGGTSPRGLVISVPAGSRLNRLPAGIYHDDNMAVPPDGSDVPRVGPNNTGAKLTPNPLNFPAELARFQTPTNQGDPNAVATIAGCSDGVLMIIEDGPAKKDDAFDLDKDRKTGLDFKTDDALQDLRRVRIIIKWTSSPP